jgi:hypothetical protein
MRHRGMASKHLPHGLRSRTQLLFPQYFARFVEQALPTRSIPRVQADRELRLRKFLVCFAATVLTFFIAGLLYLLCFEHVDNLGAYSIPPETGLFPSDYHSRTPVTRCLGHKS